MIWRADKTDLSCILRQAQAMVFMHTREDIPYWSVSLCLDLVHNIVSLWFHTIPILYNPECLFAHVLHAHGTLSFFTAFSFRSHFPFGSQLSYISSPVEQMKTIAADEGSMAKWSRVSCSKSYSDWQLKLSWAITSSTPLKQCKQATGMYPTDKDAYQNFPFYLELFILHWI